MENSFNYAEWKKRILALRQRHTRREDLEFCELVECVDRINDIDIIRTLLETFTPKCETSVQQTVVRILGSFDILLYYQAYLEALPRFVFENSGWDIELGSYPERSPTGVEIGLIAKMVNNLPLEIKNMYLNVLKNDDFYSDHSWSESLIRAIEG